MSEETHYLYQELYQLLQTDESLFAWFEQGATDGIWYWDLIDSSNEWMSPQFKALFGYTDDEIPNTSEWWQANIFPEDLPGVLANFEQHKQDPNHPYDQIVRYRHKSGATVWVRCRGLIIRDSDGTPSRMLGAHTDVSELMRSRLLQQETQAILERTLRDQTEINALALEGSDVGAWHWHIPSDTLTWDESMYRLYGIKQHDTLNFNDWWERIVPQDQSSLDNHIQGALSGKNEYRTTFGIMTSSGDVRYLKAMGRVFRDVDGTPLYMRGLNWDITEEKRIQLELERSNRDLSTFAYVASHDLKAPLRGIKQLAQWIDEDLTTNPEQVRQYLATLNGRVSRLENLLDDLLTYSRIERGDQQALETIDTVELIGELFELLITGSGCQTQSVIDVESLYTSRPMLKQVLQNLISNAIKHAPERRSSVTVQVKAERERALFRVIDSNPPIPAIHHQRIFEMFQTLRPRDEVEGSGMGLSIARRIVEERQGKLCLESSEQGNCFSFDWPLQG